MSIAEPVWEQIRRGRAPTLERVAQVAATDAAMLGSDGVASTRDALAAEVLGAGPLEPLLADVEVTDVLVNGTGGVWVDRGDGLHRADCDLGGPEAVRRLAVRLAGLAGRRLDETSPFVDGVLPGGVRLHAILPPLVCDGPHLSLRVPARLAPSLAQLRRSGSMDERTEDLLRAMVRRRRAFVVTGGTGSGKTTLLGALLGEVLPGERIVLVEDVRELAVRHPHVVRLQGRPPNVEGCGEVTLTALVRQCLRMRPDRLVVGEVRGAEVRELMSALNTGHEGGCGTVHANALGDVVARFEALGALASLRPSAVHAQLLSAVQVVVHVSREGRRRRVSAVGVLEADAVGGRPRVAPALLADGPAPLAPDPRGWPRLAALLGLDRS